jgi:AGZA family xanthine/uracil permease-like MFS transporter
VGVLYHGLAVMGGGAILGGLVLGAIAAYTIDRAFRKAAGFAAAGAVLTLFGFMHGEAIGVMQSPLVALSYAAVAAILLGCASSARAKVEPAVPVLVEERSQAGLAD